MLKENLTPLRATLMVAAQDTAPLSPEVQRAAWSLASRVKDMDLLAALTLRADLTDDLTALAKARREIPVRVAYLNRPGLPREEFMALLKDEERAGVLAGACAEGSLAGKSDLVALLEARLTAKPTVGLARTVVTLNGGSPSLYAKALEVMINRRDDPSDVQRAVLTRAQLVAESGIGADQILAVLDERSLDSQAGRVLIGAPGTSTQARLDIVNRFLASAIRKVQSTQGGGHRFGSPERLVSSMVGSLLAAPDLTEEILATLKAQLAPVAPGSRSMADLLARVDAYDPGEEERAANARRALLAEARTTPDLGRQAEIASQISYQNAELRGALAENPHLAGPALEAVVLWPVRGDEEDTVKLAARGGRDLLLRLYASNPAVYVQVDKWQSFDDPAQARIDLVRGLSDGSVLHVHEGYARDSVLLSIAQSVEDDDPCLGELPWDLLARQVRGYHADSPTSRRMCRWLVSAQQRTLGDDPEKWETLEVLSRDFSGSLSDLVAASAAL